MSQSSTAPDRRAEHVALGGALIQLVVGACLFAVARWDRSDAILAASLFAAAGFWAWMLTWRIFVRIRFVHAEALETAELRRQQEAGTANPLFAVDAEGLLLEQSRLRWLVRWAFPVVTFFVAFKLLGGATLKWNWGLGDAFERDAVSMAVRPTLSMWFVIGCGFVAFMFAMYTAGLSRLREFRLLRSGAGYLAGTALVCLGLAVALGATGTASWAQPLVAYLVRVLMIVLGLELLINQLLDFYRPRTGAIVSRPAFESRILGLISEPGGVAKSLADAINYQFGFEVSATWFYRFLQRWMIPLSAATIVVILLLTSVVVVGADEQAVVETFGRVNQPQARLLSPGMHFKWPYPISRVTRTPARRIQEFVIGEALESKREGHENEAVLWTEQHESTPELMLLVATAPDSVSGSSATGTAATAAVAGESVAVSMMMVSIPIQYPVRDVSKYLYNYEDPQLVLEGVAYQYLSDYAAGVTIDQLMGPAREEFNAEVRQIIQKRADELELGVEIVFVGLHSAHPPADDKVAESFQGVMNAEIIKTNQVNRAQAEEQAILTTAVGSVDRAYALDAAILAFEEVSRSNADEAAKTAARAAVDTLLMGDSSQGIAPASGEVARRLAEAQIEAANMKRSALSKTQGFAAEVAGYLAAPEIYKVRKQIDVYRGMDSVRKFLILADPSNIVIEYDSGSIAPLDRVLQEGLREELKRK